MALFGGDESLNIIVRLQDEASKQLSELQKKLEGMQKSIAPAASASRAFALALGGAATAAAGFGIMAVKAAADSEQTAIAFETMLGSAEKAKTFVKDLVSFAAKTPFELKGLEASAKQLLAYGFAQDEVLPNLKSLGDIASGVGMDKLPNLILAFGQVKAATRLTGMELRQFTEAGVPLLQALADQLGKPVAEIQKMVSAGEIGFPMVQKALADMTKEGGKFNNLMGKQAQSLGGMWSNLQDAWDMFLRGQGALLIDWAKQLVAVLIDLVNNQLPKWIEQTKQIVDWLSQHKEVLIIIAGAITGALIPAAYAAAVAFTAMMLPLLPWILGGAAIGALVAGIVWIVKNWEMIKDKAVAIWDAIADYFVGKWDAMTGAIYSAWNSVKDFFAKVWDQIKVVFDFAIQVLVGLVIIAFDAMGIDIVRIFQGIQAFFGDSWADIQNKFNEALTAIKTLWTTIWTTIGNFIGPIWEKIKGAALAGLAWIRDKFKELAAPIESAWNSLWAGLTSTVTMAWESVKNVIKSSINWIIDKVNAVIKAINEVAAKGAAALKVSAYQIPLVPALAEGGVVTRPTIAMVGEAGPEAVIPLSKMGQMGGGMTININNPQVRSDSDLDRMKEMIEEVMRPVMLNMKIGHT